MSKQERKKQHRVEVEPMMGAPSLAPPAPPTHYRVVENGWWTSGGMPCEAKKGDIIVALAMPVDAMIAQGVKLEPCEPPKPQQSDPLVHAPRIVGKGARRSVYFANFGVVDVEVGE